LPPEQQAKFLASLNQNEARALIYDWRFWARPKQLPPGGAWRFWLILAGRGFGKTRTGAEWVRQQVKHYPYVNLIGATSDDARDIMVEGESGILAICPDDERPEYKTQKSRLEWPNGAKSLIFTADRPDRLRGKQHYKLWADELASWRYVNEAWDQAMMGLRLGDNPQAIITTTPRPITAIRELIENQHCVVTRGTSYENRANLAPAFFDQIIRRYEGTRLGRQELNAEILEDNPGALWKREWIDAARETKAPALHTVVVAMDPAATSGGDACGIVAAGVARQGGDEHLYVLEDATINGTPTEQARAAVTLYHKINADRLVVEKNNGGEWLETVIKQVDDRINVVMVHASRGKHTRAEPVSALYQQGRGHHVGVFPELEDELCQWEPGNDSPNRLDALVWAAHSLTLGGAPPAGAPIVEIDKSAYKKRRPSRWRN
jgi:phage terminase large subunit-like protein